jgi:hypothetical protein
MTVATTKSNRRRQNVELMKLACGRIPYRRHSTMICECARSALSAMPPATGKGDEQEETAR